MAGEDLEDELVQLLAEDEEGPENPDVRILRAMTPQLSVRFEFGARGSMVSCIDGGDLEAANLRD